MENEFSGMVAAHLIAPAARVGCIDGGDSVALRTTYSL